MMELRGALQSAATSAADRGERLYVATDIETTGLNPRQDKITCIGVAWRADEAHIVPARKLRALAAEFSHPNISWVWHNGKFDAAFLRERGHEARVDEDTMLLSYAIDEIGGIHGLEQIASDLLGAPDYKYMVDPYVKGKGGSYAKVPARILYKYLSLDLSNTLQIFQILRRRVKEDARLEKLYTRTLIPASNFLAEVEHNGLFVDQARVQANGRMYRREMDRWEGEITRLNGEWVNPNSPKQVAEMLFEKFKLPNRGRGSTAKEYLDKLPPHPVVHALREYRKASKALGTYINGVLKHIEDSGRVHSTFKIHGTRTGRLSSAEPNIQNIPRRHALRSQFSAPPGRILVDVDLSQAELRSLAALSRDEVLCGIYNDTNRSLHKEVAAKQFGKGYSDEQYMRAKALTFGIVYGRKGPSIAAEFEIPVDEGVAMVDGWFNQFPQAHDFIIRCRGAPVRLQTIVTAFGRKKRHHLVSRELLPAMQNEAANFPHQSIASDITLHGAMRAHAMMQHPDSQMDAMIVNLVHDSILVECVDNQEVVQRVVSCVVNCLESVASDFGITRVPFLAEAKYGYHWSTVTMKEVTPNRALEPYNHG